jgi:Fe-S cluster biogenesis protein NfuA
MYIWPPLVHGGAGKVVHRIQDKVVVGVAGSCSNCVSDMPQLREGVVGGWVSPCVLLLW